MTDSQFREIIEASEVFKSFEVFKQNIFIKTNVLQRLKIYYDQALRYGINYLRQNPNLTVSEVNLIASML